MKKMKQHQRNLRLRLALEWGKWRTCYPKSETTRFHKSWSFFIRIGFIKPKYTLKPTCIAYTNKWNGAFLSHGHVLAGGCSIFIRGGWRGWTWERQTSLYRFEQKPAWARQAWWINTLLLKIVLLDFAVLFIAGSLPIYKRISTGYFGRWRGWLISINARS